MNFHLRKICKLLHFFCLLFGFSSVNNSRCGPMLGKYSSGKFSRVYSCTAITIRAEAYILGDPSPLTDLSERSDARARRGSISTNPAEPSRSPHCPHSPAVRPSVPPTPPHYPRLCVAPPPTPRVLRLQQRATQPAAQARSAPLRGGLPSRLHTAVRRGAFRDSRRKCAGDYADGNALDAQRAGGNRRGGACSADPE